MILSILTSMVVYESLNDCERYFIPDASQSEIDRAKEVLFNTKVEEYLNYMTTSEANEEAKSAVKTCFSPVLLPMHKMLTECNSIHLSLKFVDKREGKTIFEKSCNDVGWSSNDCRKCMNFDLRRIDIDCGGATVMPNGERAYYDKYFNLSRYPDEARIFLKNEPNELEITKAKRAIAKQIIRDSDGIYLRQIEECWYNRESKFQISNYKNEWLAQQYIMDDQAKVAFKISTYIIAIFGPGA